MHCKISKFDIISSICVISLLIPAIIFYHFRNHSIKLSLNGTIVDASECIQTSTCQNGLCIIKLSGYVTLNYTYDGSEYSTKTSPAECCAGDCCRELKKTQQPVWIILAKKGTDPEHINTFSCTQLYNNDVYYWLCGIFFGLFCIGILFLLFCVWCDKINKKEKIPLLQI